MLLSSFYWGAAMVTKICTSNNIVLCKQCGPLQLEQPAPLNVKKISILKSESSRGLVLHCYGATRRGSYHGHLHCTP
jgi:hypothetical protein